MEAEETWSGVVVTCGPDAGKIKECGPETGIRYNPNN